MSFEAELTRDQLKSEYQGLKRAVGDVVRSAQNWENKAVALEASTAVQAELDEIDAQRQSLITQLRAVFGI